MDKEKRSGKDNRQATLGLLDKSRKSLQIGKSPRRWVYGESIQGQSDSGVERFRGESIQDRTALGMPQRVPDGCDDSCGFRPGFFFLLLGHAVGNDPSTDLELPPTA
jgi:hypothetical protein